MASGIKTGGRKKGTPNKLSVSVRQAVLDTFEQLGGTKHMRTWAEANPSEFYRILARIAPHSSPPELSAAGSLADHGLVVIGALSAGRLTPEEASTILGGLAAQARIVETTELEKRLAALEKISDEKH